MDRVEIDAVHDEKQEELDLTQATPDSTTVASTSESLELVETPAKVKGKCTKNHKHRKSDRKAAQKEKKSEDDSDADAESNSSSATSESSSDESSEEEKKSRRKKLGRKLKGKKLPKKSKKSRYDSSDDESSDSESSESSSSEEEARRRRKKKRPKKARVVSSEEEEESAASTPSTTVKSGRTSRRSKKQLKEKKAKKMKKGSLTEFMRVNHVWNNTEHAWKTTEDIEDANVGEFDEYAFLVKRSHNYDGHYLSTSIEIRSKHLKDVLMELMKDVQGETLEAAHPSIDPNMLFNFLEDLRVFYKKTLRSRLRKEKKRKGKRELKQKIAHSKLLVAYLDEDYDETKKTLYPLLEAGNITFELLWSLFKPNILAYTSTYGDHDNPRCFKVDRAIKQSSMMKGEWYAIEGRYLEYDGKNYGLGEFDSTVEAFKGSRKITSLATYPLKYHKDPEAVKLQMIERGKEFVTMTGQNYRNFKGLAFQKKKKNIAKYMLSGRIMIDPATFRRINANYPISTIKPKDGEDDDESDSEANSCCGGGSDSEEYVQTIGKKPKKAGDDDEGKMKTKLKIIKDSKGRYHIFRVQVDDDGSEVCPERLVKIASDKDSKSHVFTEEELLIASPVVVGFSFQEKTWLEFSLSAVAEIEWNDEAYQSLVLPKNQKNVVKALVSAHKFHGSRTIDDVVQGKGKGLVFVLHGPPGVGKTLTAEGIAEDLRVPLYMVSMGELAMDSARLEGMLQQIMDIAHSWGAVLLLDEADVFLEKRQIQDVQRNALVSIFLRLLEYFQGILFLTTNRVETFDEAFQSRIHVALRYEELSIAASKQVWHDFIEKVRVKEGLAVMPFKPDDYEHLARKKLNGRQIKNIVRTAQALALHEETSLSMEHIKRVLDVHESFDQDLKGGTGYLDAMRSYT